MTGELRVENLQVRYGRTDAVRGISLEVPAGVTEIRIDAAQVEPSERHPLLAADAAGDIALGAVREATLPSTDTMRPARLELRLGAAVDARSVPAPPRRLVPVARRVLTRWRDRPRPPAAGTRG